MVLRLKDGRKELYQWDVGVVADVTDENINEVHFSNLRYGVSFNVEVQNGTVTIPPEVLQSGADVFCWAFVRQENGGYTKKEQIFNVEKRPRPADYIYEPTDVLTWEALKQQIEEVEKGTIKLITEEVRLLDLETGLYNVKGGKVLWDEENMAMCGVFDGILYVVHDMYLIKMSAIGEVFVNGAASTSAFVECYKENDEWKVYQVSTAPVSRLFESETERIPTVSAVIDYVEALKTEIMGNLDEVSALVGGDILSGGVIEDSAPVTPGTPGTPNYTGGAE